MVIRTYNHEHVLPTVKVYFERRQLAEVFITHVQDSHLRKRISKENFLVCRSLPLAV